MATKSGTRRIQLLGSLVLAVLLVFSSSAAAAAPREPVEYDALGDSYAAGWGVPPYDAFGRSESAYPVQIDGRMRIDLDDFVAVPGATTQTVILQLSALDASTDMVTLSIGGNDVDWGTAVGACLGGTDPQCAAAIGYVNGLITTALPGLLDQVYDQVEALAPAAHVVITGYPRLFSPEFGDYYAASTGEQEALNATADLLNTVIATAAAEHGFQFVDVTSRFVGHGANAPAAWILGPGDASFHPNLHGYRAYAAALTSQIIPSSLQ